MKNVMYRVLLTMGMAFFLIFGMTGCGNNEKTADGTIVTTQASTQVSSSEEITTEVVTRGGNDFSITITSNNSWENGDMTCTQFDGVIKNNSDDTGSDWKVTVAVPDGSEMENGWNGTYAINGTILEITPVDYNVDVTPGGEVSFGFILNTPSAFTLDQVALNIAGSEYTMGASSEDLKQEEEAQTEDNTKEETTEATKVSEKDTSGTPVANHGALSVKGTNIVDKNGEIFQLRGVSTHGINWFPEYVNKEAFSDLSEYGVNAIRLAMYTADYNGYCSGGNQKDLEGIIDKGVQACTELGMYVIVDWHILNDNDPNQNKDTAKLFFEKMSEKYASNDNVIYEICNEPNGGTTWESVKSYAEEIIPIIRQNDKDALIIVGTPNWSQDVDVASNNPITGQENIVYAVHFYASTHKDNIRSKVETAISNGLPVIVSESSICEASGNGSINYDEGEIWMELIKKYNLSCFAWSLGNKDETSSFLKSSVTKTSGFSKDDFSEIGQWYLEQYSK